jgi:hypothetical protein
MAMRLSAPTLTLTDAEAIVDLVLEPGSDGAAPVHLRFGVPRHLVGAIDLTARPFVPVASLLALLHGEPLHVGADVPAMQRRGATEAVGRLAPWIGRPPITVEPTGDPSGDEPPGGANGGRTGPDGSGVDELDPTVGRGVGMFFTRGVDSWASLRRHRGRVTHLLAVDGIEPLRSPDQEAVVWAGHERVAAELGLPLIRFTTNARDVLDRLTVWDWTHGAVLASCGLLLAPLLGTVVLAGSYPSDQQVPWGSSPSVDPCWSNGSTTVEHDGADQGRWEKTATLVDDPLALATLHVCWEGAGAGNCGRCEKCLRTMTTLAALGVLDRVPFETPLAPALVAALPPAEGHVVTFVEELLVHLGPGNPLRSAWASLLDSAGEPIRVPAGSTPVAGPGLTARVGPALASLGRIPLISGPEATYETSDGARRRSATPTDDPDTGTTRSAPDPGAPAVDAVTLLDVGWGPGQVPLRPAAADAAQVLAQLRGGDRPVLWVVAEPHDPGNTGATGQMRLVDRLTRDWGAGLTYLPGVSWAPSQAPGLDAEAVGRMLRAARVRLWWRDDGPLDPLRTIESIEHGCLPLQVMPAGAALAARRSLPLELAALVVDDAQIAGFDLDPDDLTRRRDDAAGVLLSGSIERDLFLHVGPVPPVDPVGTGIATGAVAP